MRALARIQKRDVVRAALLLFVVLACGPLDRWQQQNQQQQAIATSVAIIDENSQLIVGAYQKLQSLPGYRLESRRVVRDESGNQTSYTIFNEYDTQGNNYIRIEDPVHQIAEFYLVEGHTYLFDPHYEGWIDSGTDAPSDLRRFAGDLSLTNLSQLLIQLGAVPIKAGRETVANRPATRYRLRDIVTEISEALNQDFADIPLELRGTLWVDETTGALLKADLFLYQNQASLPVLELNLEVSEIGNIQPITAPSPLVIPQAIVSATATAQAWSVLSVDLDHQGETISFELIPLLVTQTPDSSPRQAQVRLILRDMPDQLFRGANLEPFLAQLRHQMTLSLPRRNLVITSSGFRLNSSDSQDHRAEVIYFFNADLEDFSHAELIIDGKGNPLIAPVPVEESKTEK